MIVWLTNRIDEENGESFKINTADLDNLGAIADFVVAMAEEKGMLPPYNENHGISDYDLAMGQPVEATNNWED